MTLKFSIDMRIIILMVFIALYSNTFAQKITGSDLVYMMSKNESTINEFLIEKGWKFIRHFPETDESLSSTIWSFPVVGENSTKCLGSITIGMDEKSVNVLEYLFNSKTGFTEIVTYLKSIKAQKTEPMLKPDYIVDTYFGKNYVYTVISNSKSNDNGAFTVQVRPRTVYINAIIEKEQKSKN